MVADDPYQLANQPHFALPGPEVAPVAHQESPDGTGGDHILDTLFELLFGWAVLGQILDGAALLAVLALNGGDPRIISRSHHGIDAVLFAQPPGGHDFLAGKIMLQQGRHINQVAAVGIAANEYPRRSTGWC